LPHERCLAQPVLTAGAAAGWWAVRRWRSTTGVASDPTVFMPANPQVGDVFNPEDLFPIVDETAEVVATGKTVLVPAGRYKGVIVVKESMRLPRARNANGMLPASAWCRCAPKTRRCSWTRPRWCT